MQGTQQDDREWEHWPGRTTGDERIRARLRALFSATGAAEDTETLLSERARQIQEQADRLQATIDDLERREEQAGRVRSAVEEMLRRGSAELDERQAALTALAQDLRARDERMREQERDLALRKQELGAVELRRAAVERREEALAAREAALEVAEVRQKAASLRLARPGTADPGPATEAPDHVLWVADQGYRLVDRPGSPPAVGSFVALDERMFVVLRVGRSPLPGDRRSFAYLEPLHTSAV